MFITSTFYSVFGRNYDGFSIPEMRMYVILWCVFFSFHLSHFEKYNTGIMYLPWTYDFSMLGGTLIYLITAFAGYQLWKFKLPGDYSMGPFLEAILYSGVYLMALPLALKNIVASYRDRTGKMRTPLEAARPMASFIAAMILCLGWATFSKNGILVADVRCFFYMSGTIYANMSCRLIVAQMSNSRCELLNYLLLPLFLVVAASLALPAISLKAELGMLYGLSLVATLVHVHYGVCVVRQMCDHLNIDCFRIKSDYRLINQQEQQQPVCDDAGDGDDEAV